MERRPLSAPGYHPKDANEGADDAEPLATGATGFAEIEERASAAMGKENRGHKLSLEELPLERPRLLPGRESTIVPPTEEEFEVGAWGRGKQLLSSPVLPVGGGEGIL